VGRKTRRQFLQAGAAAVGTAALGCSTTNAPPGRKVASLWFSYGGRNRRVLEQLVHRFNHSQAVHWIHAVYQGDYFEALAKLRTAIAAKAGPAFSHVVGEVVPYLAGAGVLEKLDDYPGARGLDVIPALGQDGSWIGGDKRPLVALPFNRSTPIAYLNGDLFDKSGLARPTTWQELREAARALTVRSGGRTTRYGFGCPIDWWFWVALVGQAGGQVVDPDGRVSLGGPAGVEALELWQHMVSQDHSMKPPPGRDYNAWEATNQDYLAGRTAMIWTSTAFLKYLEDNAPFPVVAAPLPARQRHAVPTGGTFWVIVESAPAEQKQTAWAFLRWVLEPEQVITWATNTGYMPVTRAAVQRLDAEGYYQRHPNDHVAYEQLRVAMPWPWSAELFRIQREIVQPRLESAVLSHENAQKLLDAARVQAKRSLG
jgi:sn-glycerol 3-phosphate transport system substrate-binding protein